MYSDTLELDISFDVPVHRPALFSRETFDVPVRPLDAKGLILVACEIKGEIQYSWTFIFFLSSRVVCTLVLVSPVSGVVSTLVHVSPTSGVVSIGYSLVASTSIVDHIAMLSFSQWFSPFFWSWNQRQYCLGRRQKILSLPVFVEQQVPQW